MSANMTTTKQVMKRAFVDVHLIKMLDRTADRTYGAITIFNFTNFFSAKIVVKYLPNKTLISFLNQSAVCHFSLCIASPEMPGVNFTNVLRAAFTFYRYQKRRKKDSQVKQLFCAFGICVSKSCS